MNHFVNGKTLREPFPDHMQRAVFGLGCFWGAERVFWETDGVYTTAVGYAGGTVPDPTYQDVCTGNTGHAEVVLVVFFTVRVDLRQTTKQPLSVIGRRLLAEHSMVLGAERGDGNGPIRGAIRRSTPAVG